MFARRVTFEPRFLFAYTDPKVQSARAPEEQYTQVPMDRLNALFRDSRENSVSPAISFAS